MRVLLDHHEPFLLAHGGLQILIEKTAGGLRGIGVEVECLRWWDADQRGDIIHFFGRPPAAHVRMARQKGIRYVMHELLTSQGSRPRALLRAQGLVTRLLSRALPPSYRIPFRWESYQLADAVLASTTWEAEIMETLFDAPRERLHVIPTGVDEVFFLNPRKSATPPKSDPLVCLATITERKRVVELARAAVLAGIPLTIIGRPYAVDDRYFRSFLDVVEKSGGLVNYPGPINDPAALAPILRQARGFVLLSAMETQSTAALAAAAAGCPLLLSDLPWARCTFGDSATYVPPNAGVDETAAALKNFNPGSKKCPARPASWRAVAERLSALYTRLLSPAPASRPG